MQRSGHLDLSNIAQASIEVPVLVPLLQPSTAFTLLRQPTSISDAHHPASIRDSKSQKQMRMRVERVRWESPLCSQPVLQLCHTF